MIYNKEGGGAKVEDNNKALEKVSNNNIDQFEKNDWSSVWIIHDNMVAAPVQTKKEYIKEAIVQKRKRTKKASIVDKLSKLTGLAKLNASKGGLFSTLYKGVQQGRKAYDDFSRGMDKLGDSITGRGTYGKKIRSSISNAYARTRKKGNTRKGYDQYGNPIKSTGERLLGENYKINPLTGEVINTENLGNKCVRSVDCGSDKEEMIFCKYDFKTASSGKCAIKQCEQYGKIGLCGERHTCLPIYPSEPFKHQIHKKSKSGTINPSDKLSITESRKYCEEIVKYFQGMQQIKENILKEKDQAKNSNKFASKEEFDSFINQINDIKKTEVTDGFVTKTEGNQINEKLNKLQKIGESIAEEINKFTAAQLTKLVSVYEQKEYNIVNQEMILTHTKNLDPKNKNIHIFIIQNTTMYHSADKYMVQKFIKDNKNNEDLKIKSFVKDLNEYLNYNFEEKLNQKNDDMLMSIILPELIKNYPSPKIRDYARKFINKANNTDDLLEFKNKLEKNFIYNKNKLTYLNNYQYFQNSSSSFLKFNIIESSDYESFLTKNYIDKDNIFDLLFKANTQLYKIFKFYQDDMKSIKNDKIIYSRDDNLDETIKQAFNNITAQDTFQKKHFLHLISLDTKILFGKHEHCGILKEILFNLYYIIYQDDQTICSYNILSNKQRISENPNYSTASDIISHVYDSISSHVYDSFSLPLTYDEDENFRLANNPGYKHQPVSNNEPAHSNPVYEGNLSSVALYNPDNVQPVYVNDEDKPFGIGRVSKYYTFSNEPPLPNEGWLNSYGEQLYVNVSADGKLYEYVHVLPNDTPSNEIKFKRPENSATYVNIKDPSQSITVTRDGVFITGGSDILNNLKKIKVGNKEYGLNGSNNNNNDAIIYSTANPGHAPNKGNDPNEFLTNLMDNNDLIVNAVYASGRGRGRDSSNGLLFKGSSYRLLSLFTGKISLFAKDVYDTSYISNIGVAGNRSFTLKRTTSTSNQAGGGSKVDEQEAEKKKEKEQNRDLEIISVLKNFKKIDKNIIDPSLINKAYQIFFYIFRTYLKSDNFEEATGKLLFMNNLCSFLEMIIQNKGELGCLQFTIDNNKIKVAIKENLKAKIMKTDRKLYETLSNKLNKIFEDIEFDNETERITSVFGINYKVEHITTFKVCIDKFNSYQNRFRALFTRDPEEIGIDNKEELQIKVKQYIERESNKKKDKEEVEVEVEADVEEDEEESGPDTVDTVERATAKGDTAKGDTAGAETGEAVTEEETEDVETEEEVTAGSETLEEGETGETGKKAAEEKAAAGTPTAGAKTEAGLEGGGKKNKLSGGASTKRRGNKEGLCYPLIGKCFLETPGPQHISLENVNNSSKLGEPPIYSEKRYKDFYEKEIKKNLSIYLEKINNGTFFNDIRMNEDLITDEDLLKYFRIIQRHDSITVSDKPTQETLTGNLKLNESGDPRLQIPTTLSKIGKNQNFTILELIQLKIKLLFFQNIANKSEKFEDQSIDACDRYRVKQIAFSDKELFEPKLTNKALPDIYFIYETVPEFNYEANYKELLGTIKIRLEFLINNISRYNPSANSIPVANATLVYQPNNYDILDTFNDIYIKTSNKKYTGFIKEEDSDLHTFIWNNTLVLNNLLKEDPLTHSNYFIEIMRDGNIKKYYLDVNTINKLRNIIKNWQNDDNIPIFSVKDYFLLHRPIHVYNKKEEFNMMDLILNNKNDMKKKLEMTSILSQKCVTVSKAYYEKTQVSANVKFDTKKNNKKASDPVVNEEKEKFKDPTYDLGEDMPSEKAIQNVYTACDTLNSYKRYSISSNVVDYNDKINLEGKKKIIRKYINKKKYNDAMKEAGNIIKNYQNHFILIFSIEHNNELNARIDVDMKSFDKNIKENIYNKVPNNLSSIAEKIIKFCKEKQQESNELSEYDSFSAKYSKMNAIDDLKKLILEHNTLDTSLPQDISQEFKSTYDDFKDLSKDLPEKKTKITLNDKKVYMKYKYFRTLYNDIITVLNTVLNTNPVFVDTQKKLIVTFGEDITNKNNELDEADDTKKLLVKYPSVTIGKTQLNPENIIGGSMEPKQKPKSNLTFSDNIFVILVRVINNLSDNKLNMFQKTINTKRQKIIDKTLENVNKYYNREINMGVAKQTVPDKLVEKLNFFYGKGETDSDQLSDDYKSEIFKEIIEKYLDIFLKKNYPERMGETKNISPIEDEEHLNYLCNDYIGISLSDFRTKKKDIINNIIINTISTYAKIKGQEEVLEEEESNKKIATCNKGHITKTQLPFSACETCMKQLERKPYESKDESKNIEADISSTLTIRNDIRNDISESNNIKKILIEYFSLNKSEFQKFINELEFFNNIKTYVNHTEYESNDNDFYDKFSNMVTKLNIKITTDNEEPSISNGGGNTNKKTNKRFRRHRHITGYSKKRYRGGSNKSGSSSTLKSDDRLVTIIMNIVEKFKTDESFSKFFYKLFRFEYVVGTATLAGVGDAPSADVDASVGGDAADPIVRAPVYPIRFGYGLGYEKLYKLQIGFYCIDNEGNNLIISTDKNTFTLTNGYDIDADITITFRGTTYKLTSIKTPTAKPETALEPEPEPGLGPTPTHELGSEPETEPETELDQGLNMDSVVENPRTINCKDGFKYALGQTGLKVNKTKKEYTSTSTPGYLIPDKQNNGIIILHAADEGQKSNVDDNYCFKNITDPIIGDNELTKYENLIKNSFNKDNSLNNALIEFKITNSDYIIYDNLISDNLKNKENYYKYCISQCFKKGVYDNIGITHQNVKKDMNINDFYKSIYNAFNYFISNVNYKESFNKIFDNALDHCIKKDIGFNIYPILFSDNKDIKYKTRAIVQIGYDIDDIQQIGNTKLKDKIDNDTIQIDRIQVNDLLNLTYDGGRGKKKPSKIQKYMKTFNNCVSEQFNNIYISDIKIDTIHIKYNLHYVVSDKEIKVDEGSIKYDLKAEELDNDNNKIKLFKNITNTFNLKDKKNTIINKDNNEFIEFNKEYIETIPEIYGYFSQNNRFNEGNSKYSIDEDGNLKITELILDEEETDKEKYIKKNEHILMMIITDILKNKKAFICERILNYLVINTFSIDGFDKSAKTEFNFVDINSKTNKKVKLIATNDNFTELELQVTEDAKTPISSPLSYDRKPLYLYKKSEDTNSNDKKSKDTKLQNIEIQSFKKEINTNTVFFTFGITGSGKDAFKDIFFDEKFVKEPTKSKFYYLGNNVTGTGIDEKNIQAYTPFNPQSTRGFSISYSKFKDNNNNNDNDIIQLNIPGFEPIVDMVSVTSNTKKTDDEYYKLIIEFIVLFNYIDTNKVIDFTKLTEGIKINNEYIDNDKMEYIKKDPLGGGPKIFPKINADKFTFDQARTKDEQKKAKDKVNEVIMRILESLNICNTLVLMVNIIKKQKVIKDAFNKKLKKVSTNDKNTYIKKKILLLDVVFEEVFSKDELVTVTKDDFLTKKIEDVDIYKDKIKVVNLSKLLDSNINLDNLITKKTHIDVQINTIKKKFFEKNKAKKADIEANFKHMLKPLQGGLIVFGNDELTKLLQQFKTENDLKESNGVYPFISDFCETIFLFNEDINDKEQPFQRINVNVIRPSRCEKETNKSIIQNRKIEAIINTYQSALEGFSALQEQVVKSLNN
jgi:hypothetical protein